MDKKNVLVTGCSRGIGLAIAKKLIDEGYFVVGTSRSKIDLADLLGSDNCLHQAVDVSNEDDISSMIESLTKQDIHIHCLVNNAGITRDSTFRKMTLEQWDQVMHANLRSVFNMTRLVINGMLEEKWGRVINISSVNGQKGQFGQSNYAAAKAGMHGFTKSLAQEVASKGITVNTVSPGYIMTAMVAAIGDEILEKIASTIPVGRLGNPDEIAYAVAFLASERAAFVTGSNLAINGGQHMF